jgi:hypothetical protein
MPAEDLSNAIKKELSEYQSTISAMNQTAQEIRDGKYTTRADAVAAMTKRSHPERAAATQPEP